MKFDKELFNSAAGEEAFLGLYRSYFGNGGQQLSVTVVSPEELVDAQKNPDAHRDLIVRVGGYSDYFVNLPKEDVYKRQLHPFAGEDARGARRSA